MKIKIKSWNKKLLEPYIEKAKKKCIKDIIENVWVQFFCNEEHEWGESMGYLGKDFKLKDDTIIIKETISKENSFCNHEKHLFNPFNRIEEEIIKKLKKERIEVEIVKEHEKI